MSISRRALFGMIASAPLVAKQVLSEPSHEAGKWFLPSGLPLTKVTGFNEHGIAVTERLGTLHVYGDGFYGTPGL